MSQAAKTGVKQRDSFTTSIGVLTATLGSAVGLGNIWKFPYLTGENGGAAFILIYLIAVLFAGLPVMISEFIIGRRTKSNAIRAFKELAPERPWYLVGTAGAIGAVLIMAFYSTVVGWVLGYVFKAVTGGISSTDPNTIAKAFETFSSGTIAPLFWQLTVLAITSLVIMAGVSKGIERITKTLMPTLLLLLIISDIRALSLPNAVKGIEFLFNPDFTKITGSVILIALGLAFFKLSLGMSTMITYGSYIGSRENLPKTAVKVVLADTLVSILAGLAIFPAVFSFGFQPDVGPQLLFITIPLVFNSMPFGQVFLVLFFLLAFIAAVGAMLSMVEVPVAYFAEELKWSRVKATLLTVVIIAVIGSTSTLSFGVLQGFEIFGLTAFGTLDFLTSNILMPLSGIFICLFIGWRLKGSEVMQELSNNRAIRNEWFVKAFLFVVRYIAPVAITIVFLHALKVF